MKSTSLRAKALGRALQSGTLKGTLCALLTGTAFCGLAAPAAAQTPREHRALDSNGVDLTHGDFVMAFVEGSIGSGDGELALIRTKVASGNGQSHVGSGGHQWDGIFLGRIVGPSGTTYSVDKDNRYELFGAPGTLPTGSSLAVAGAQHHYRTADGILIVFGDPSGSASTTSNYCNGTSGQGTCYQLPLSITAPSGRSVALQWELWTSCEDILIDENTQPNCSYWARLGSVSNSSGYGIAFTYDSNGGGSVGTEPPPNSWQRRTGAAFYNTKVGTNPQATTFYSYPSPDVVEVIDTGSRQWRFTGNWPGITGIQRPGATSDTTTIAYSGAGNSVSSVTRDGVTTAYSRSVIGNEATMTVTNALNQVTTIKSDVTIGRPTSVTVHLGTPTAPVDRTTRFSYDGSGRLTRTTAPEGNYVELRYDARGNVDRTEAVPKGGAGPAIVTSASYDPACANPVKCNQPNSTTDARGNVTTYDYHPDHGGVTRITSPAPTPNAVQPETRFSYTLIDGVYRLTGISQCQTANSCAGTADEVKTALAYDPNGNVNSTESRSGDAALVATTTMTYDPVGNLVAVDGPLPGPADTGRIRYNSARQVIGTVSPDPDGAGHALRHRAVRNSYDSSGLPTKVEQGNVDGQSDAEWAAFAPALAVETSYDSNARPEVVKLTSGSAVHTLSQTSYDALGRPDCSAQRMNRAEFGSPPPPACTLDTQGTGPNDYGPDRITKTFYDAAGRVTEVKTALGTLAEASEVTTTYTPNGQVHTVTDGENNKTTYEYDGHDRLYRTYYPMPTRGAATSNASDYEQWTYESLAGGTRTSGLAVSFRNRANETIGFGYDALDRRTFKDLPGSEPDVTYAYDLLGRLTGASRTGHSIGFEWDALGRLRAQTNPIGRVTAEYDLAGRRTLLKWPTVAVFPSGYQVAYERLVTGEVTAMREGAPLTGPLHAAFDYDDLGRRSLLTRGNDTSTGYGYDAASHLSSLNHDFAGTARDLTLEFEHNPAGQIVLTRRSNDAFVWTGHGSGSQASTPDGLNRVTDGGGSALTYDPKGNVVSLGARSFSYSSENLSLSEALGAQSVTRGYDPLTRLSSTFLTGNAAPSEFLWFGEEMIGEYYNETFALLYVHGPGVDEPLVSVYGNGNRFWFHADERGSVIAGSDPTGAAPYVNTYDEYGRGGGSGAFRFGFTGQIALGPDRLYFKARMYDPGLGRFMQADPIGYGGGMNMYAYVGGDPVNFVDPMGLCKDGAGKNVGAPTGSRICDGHGRASTYGGIAGHLSGSTTAGPGGAGGPTFGEAYHAAQDSVGGYGSAAVKAAADYLMGNATLGLVYVRLLSAEVAAQSGGRDHQNMIRLSKDGTSGTLNALFSDRDVEAAMISTFDRSVREQREWGFWIGQRGSDFFAYAARPGVGAFINIFEFRPSGSNIAFHTHPFKNLPQGLSGNDLLRADRNGILLMSLSRYGYDWADYRR